MVKANKFDWWKFVIQSKLATTRTKVTPALHCTAPTLLPPTLKAPAVLLRLSQSVRELTTLPFTQHLTHHGPH